MRVSTFLTEIGVAINKQIILHSTKWKNNQIEVADKFSTCREDKSKSWRFQAFSMAKFHPRLPLSLSLSSFSLYDVDSGSILLVDLHPCRHYVILSRKALLGPPRGQRIASIRAGQYLLPLTRSLRNYHSRHLSAHSLCQRVAIILLHTRKTTRGPKRPTDNQRYKQKKKFLKKYMRLRTKEKQGPTITAHVPQR